MQLRQRVSKAKPSRLKKVRAKGVQKTPEFENLASKQPIWQPCSQVSCRIQMSNTAILLRHKVIHTLLNATVL